MHGKFTIGALAIGATLFASCVGNQQPTAETSAQDATQTYDFPLHRGVNIDHWLSQRGEGVDIDPNYITRKDFETIKSLGFDFVRVPIEEQLMYNEDLTRREIGFALLDSAVQWSKDIGLKMICDLHIIRSFHFNSENAEANSLFESEKAQDNFVKVWSDLQDFLKDVPNELLAYELLNEVTTPNPEDWNALIAKVHASIRSTEPNRKIIIGSNHWQIPSTFPDLRIPEGDKNIILSFHFYDPIVITHYCAPWAEFKTYKGAYQYPGDVLKDKEYFDTIKDTALRSTQISICGEWNSSRIEKSIMMAKTVADSLGLPLFCGEFGVYPYHIDKETRLRWYDDIMSVFRKLDIPCCHWGYKNDFPCVTVAVECSDKSEQYTIQANEVIPYITK